MPERRLRWGLVSTARINERLIPAIRESPRCELLAVGSGSGLDRATRYAAGRNIPRAYGSYEELLSDPDVDVVYISLPNSLHTTWSVAAAQAGKHVLCEKPLALSVVEVEQIAAAAARHGVVIQEAVMMRYHPQTLELARRLADGVIGEVRLIRGVFALTLSREADIRFDPALGGGSIWDLGSYPVNFIRTMLSAQAVEVQGWQATSASGVDVSFCGQLRFASGALAQLFSSFQAVPYAEADILGTNGRITLDLPYVTKVGATSHVHIERVGPEATAGVFGDSISQLEEETLTYEDIDAYRCEVDAMVASVLDGAGAVVPLWDSRNNVATLAALVESAQCGRPVRL